MAEKDTDKLEKLFHTASQFVHMGGYWGKEAELPFLSFHGRNTLQNMWKIRNCQYKCQARISLTSFPGISCLLFTRFISVTGRRNDSNT